MCVWLTIYWRHALSVFFPFIWAFKYKKSRDWVFISWRICRTSPATFACTEQGWCEADAFDLAGNIPPGNGQTICLPVQHMPTTKVQRRSMKHSDRNSIKKTKTQKKTPMVTVYAESKTGMAISHSDSPHWCRQGFYRLLIHKTHALSGSGELKHIYKHKGPSVYQSHWRNECTSTVTSLVPLALLWPKRRERYCCQSHFK